MLTLLTAMEQWVREIRATPSARFIHSFQFGRFDVPKRSAHVGFSADGRAGVVSAWDSGEVEAEVMNLHTEDRPLVVPKVIETEEELRKLLDRVLSEVGGR